MRLIAQQTSNRGAAAGGAQAAIPPAQAAQAAAAAAGGAGNAAGATLTASDVQARIAQYDNLFADSNFYGPMVTDSIKKLSGLTPVSGIHFIKEGIREMPVFDQTPARPTGLDSRNATPTFQDFRNFMSGADAMVHTSDAEDATESVDVGKHSGVVPLLCGTTSHGEGIQDG